MNIVEPLVQVLMKEVHWNRYRGAHAQRSDERTPLALAAACGKEKIASILIENGADTQEPDSKGRQALHHASLEGHKNVASLLILQSGVDVGVCDAEQKTSLHFAAMQGHEHMLRFLMDCGADLDAKDLLGSTALLEATKHAHDGAALLLLNRGADILAADNEGMDVRHWALKSKVDSDAFVGPKVSDELIALIFDRFYAISHNFTIKLPKLDKHMSYSRWIRTGQDCGSVLLTPT